MPYPTVDQERPLRMGLLGRTGGGKFPSRGNIMWYEVKKQIF